MEGKGSNASPKLTEEEERKKDCNKWHNYINFFLSLIICSILLYYPYNMLSSMLLIISDPHK